MPIDTTLLSAYASGPRLYERINMGHRYRVYEVDRNGVRYYTDKILSVKEMPLIRDGLLCNRGSIVHDLFAIYGFTEYAPSYGISITNHDDFNITYNYPTDNVGIRTTWYLEKGT